MKTRIPKTRVQAAAPNAVAHLSTPRQEALELSAEAEHATGTRKERLIKTAAKLSESNTPKTP